MFENIIEAKINSEISKIQNLDFISLNAVRNSGLSIFTKNFINAETDKIGDKDKLIDLIEKSVKLNLNYALRPKWTLLNYLFGNFDSKSSGEIISKLEIFQFYLYYPELITNYIRDSSMVVITRNKVMNLIEEADLTIYDKFTQNVTSLKIKNFFIQLFKLNYDDDSKIGLDSTIPYSYLRIFLEDKSFGEILSKFQKIEGIKDDWDLNQKTIIKIITDKYFPNEEAPEKMTFPTQTQTLTEIPKVIEVESEIARKETKTNEDEKKPVYPTDIVEESYLHPQRHIRGLFKLPEQKSIIKKIFKSDELEMRTAFKDLENIDTWYYASEYLKQIFLKNNVKIHDSTVVLFVDVLNEYFNKKEFKS